MILDSIKNAELYFGVCPRMAQAFEYIRTHDLSVLEAGRHDIDGDDIYVNIMERELKKCEDAKVEVHDVFADIQLLLVGDQEDFGWIERKDVKLPLGEFDTEKDVQFFDDKVQTIYTLRKGQFTILMPEDGHAPMIGTGSVKKAIVKVRIK